MRHSHSCFTSGNTGQSGLLQFTVPDKYEEFYEDFEKFTVWRKHGEGSAEPTYEGINKSRALLLKAGEGWLEVYRYLEPAGRWETAFQIKDLTKEGSWMHGLSEAASERNPKRYKRAYLAGIGGFDGSSIYFAKDGQPIGSVSGGFSPAKIFAIVEKGGHIILDNVSFKPR